MVRRLSITSILSLLLLALLVPVWAEQQEQPSLNKPGGAELMKRRIAENKRPVFLFGTVVREDGAPLLEPVQIEMACGGAILPQVSYTSSNGRFTFQLGGGNRDLAMTDASVSDPAGSSGEYGVNFGGARGEPAPEINLTGCELRASLPGFDSDAIQLGVPTKNLIALEIIDAQRSRW